ncbi:hypothetical protein [Streptomyces sp. NPDC000229]|uniref:hypothetical protein n=1 Tax=Streptomyces sp. NPDC000229 TaxID=3154247 RepID=UPI003322DD44
MTDPGVPDGRDEEAANDAYSATVLGSHWFERGEASPALVSPAPPRPTAAAAPDRVEGDVLRFGPGVRAATARHRRLDGSTATRVWHGTLPGHDLTPPTPQRRKAVRRYVPAAVVLLAVPAFLAWERYGNVLTVREVTVTTTGVTELGCDGTADVVGEVTTDGRPGTVTYRWERSDGTRTELLREQIRQGQERARLHLLWTFHGAGEYRGTATLIVVSPTGHTATSPSLTYRCV